jgi:hypothetical protein
MFHGAVFLSLLYVYRADINVSVNQAFFSDKRNNRKVRKYHHFFQTFFESKFLPSHRLDVDRVIHRACMSAHVKKAVDVRHL